MEEQFSQKMRGMISRLALSACLACGAVLPISAQDPTKTLPESYKVQLDNDHVRVVRVHYDAGAKLPEHTHPPGTTVYVYLNDSEGVVFRHSGNNTRAVTRPAVKTGGVRVAAGDEEHHTAENAASTPSDFLRVWFKTDNGGERNLRRRLSPTDNKFENKQMRITRLMVTQDKSTTIDTAQEPALLVSLPSGDTRWIDRAQQVPLTTVGDFLRIDFLTAPK
jgi:hypothetical protein